MENARELEWSQESLDHIQSVVDFLDSEWSSKTGDQFLVRVQEFVKQVVSNPFIYPIATHNRNLRKALITKHNAAVFMVTENKIRVLTVYDTRMNPMKIKSQLKRLK